MAVKKHRIRDIYASSMILLSVLAIAAALIFFQGCSANPEAAGAIEANAVEGQAVDFSLPDLDGNITSIEDYRGSVVVLNFWATWCPPCRAEIPDFIAVYDSYKDKSVVFFGVSADDFDSLKNFASEYGMTYPTLYDRDGSVHNMFNISAIPHTFILDMDGYIVFNQLGLMSKKQLVDAIEGAGR